MHTVHTGSNGTVHMATHLPDNPQEAIMVFEKRSVDGKCGSYLVPECSSTVCPSVAKITLQSQWFFEL